MSKAPPAFSSALPARRAVQNRLCIVVSPSPHVLAGEIRRAARLALRSQGIHRGRVEIAVIGEAEMRRQHLRWKGARGVTDVLAFDLRDQLDRGTVDGQVIVCEPVARRTARLRRGDWRGELLLYVVHGCLHLCGHDDRRPKVAMRMHAVEDALLTELGWGPVYTESGTRTRRAAAAVEDASFAKGRS